MNKCISRNPNIEWSFVESKMALINLDNADCYTLNTVGGLFYALADGKKNLDEIIELVSIKCKIDKEKIKPDLVFFAKQLESEGLIRFIS